MTHRAISRILTLSGLFLLWACTSPARFDYAATPPAATRAETIVATARPVTVTYPEYGDSKPHPWDGRVPSSYAVHGI
ncbi:MAG: hypothetical protein IIX61_02830, partial [Loktanella sp.]|nr:hypothetical protein [Loktanella sp.]